MASLASSVNRGWRVIATGFCFACFGLGSLVQGFTIWPLLYFAAGDKRRGHTRVQRAVSWSMRAFVWLMKTVGVLTYEVHGRELLVPRGQFIIANHPSLIDVVFLISFVPEADCIVKRQLWRNPFTRWPVSLAGYISNAGGEQLVADCAAALRAGRSLILFPEGTRTRPGQSHHMQRGAAQIALAAKADPRPVTITCQPATLFKGNPWYAAPPTRPHWTIKVSPQPISLAAIVTPAGPAPISARHVTQHLEIWFNRSVAAQSAERPMPPP